MTEDIRETALPNMPASCTRFGIMSASRSHATQFARALRDSPFRYTSIGTSTAVELRVTPTKDEPTKAKGRLLSNVYKAIDEGLYKSRLRSSYPCSSPPRAGRATSIGRVEGRRRR